MTRSTLPASFSIGQKTVTTPNEGAAASAAREAYEAWSAAKDTASMAVLEAFVARYRDTFYAELARARIAYLRKLGGDAAVLPPVAGLAPSFD